MWDRNAKKDSARVEKLLEEHDEELEQLKEEHGKKISGLKAIILELLIWRRSDGFDMPNELVDQVVKVLI